MNKQWFKDQFKRIGKPQSALARELNVEPSAVSRALNGNRRFKADEILAISRFFGVTIEEVVSAIDGKNLGGSFEHTGTSSTLVNGLIDTTAGGIVDYFSQSDTTKQSYPISFKPQADCKAEGYIGLTVQGDNYPDYPAGTDLVFAKPHEGYDLSELVGKTLLYEIASGDTHYQCIGKITRSSHSGQIHLTYKGKDGMYREHIYACPESTTGNQELIALQEHVDNPSFLASGNTQLKTNEAPQTTLKPLGILVKSIKNE